MGPIPVIFTRDEDKTKEELSDKPEILHPGKTANLHLNEVKKRLTFTLTKQRKHFKTA
jgi:hypothetical protein